MEDLQCIELFPKQSKTATRSRQGWLGHVPGTHFSERLKTSGKPSRSSQNIVQKADADVEADQAAEAVHLASGRGLDPAPENVCAWDLGCDQQAS
ncbi:MAG: hypothetical protein V2J42_02915, partial [Wenzhouxiangella sp.]|nr:hypothetical protein [Wenzhouxiangella sp.]